MRHGMPEICTSCKTPEKNGVARNKKITVTPKHLMDSPVFTFSLPDFAYAFLSVLLEGVPFILVGTLISGLLDQFLPSKVMLRYLPKNAFLGACTAAGMGLIFPMCECGIVPVIRRLIRKGLPVSHAVAYMLAAPIVNPIVIVSTIAAFRGQGALEMASLRVGVAFLVAVLAAMAVHNLPIRRVVRPQVLDHHDHDHDHASSASFGEKLRGSLHVAVTDFLDVMVYFVLGVGVSAAVSTALNQEVILPLALNDWLATASMMLLAFVLSLCSTSDAFIAATFIAFPAVSKLAFLVFGPMFDLKLIFIYSSVFTKRFVAGLAIGLFVLIGLICVRLGVIGL
jgi:uncharacterized membrane protein YraQ (UPF0718 family)